MQTCWTSANVAYDSYGTRRWQGQGEWGQQPSQQWEQQQQQQQPQQSRKTTLADSVGIQVCRYMSVQFREACVLLLWIRLKSVWICLTASVSVNSLSGEAAM